MKKRNKEEAGRKKRIFQRWSIALLVPCSLLLVPLLSACKPKPAGAPTASEKLKALEVKTERVVEEKIESLEERFKRERVELSAHLDYHLKRTEERITIWKQRAEADAIRRPAIERVVVKLEARTKTLREHIAKMDSATAGQWDQLKAPWQKKQGYEDYENEILKETEM